MAPTMPLQVRRSTGYTPVDADIGSYLRATVSYSDREGSGKSAMMTSEYAVQAVRGSNAAPKFADDQDPVMTGDQPNAVRSVAENTPAGVAIGGPGRGHGRGRRQTDLHAGRHQC